MHGDFLAREHLAAPLRKAAMLLHSMADADRTWLLTQIEKRQRDRLEALLEELRELDFPVDADLVRESLEPAATLHASALRDDDLSGWTADDAHRLLSEEPDDLIALLLRAGPWPWANELRLRLGARRIDAVDASPYMRAAHISPALRDAAVKVAASHHAALQEGASS